MKDIQQLIKKNSQEGRYEDIFPKTFIDAVLDKESGVTLTDILAMFNMLFISYNGSRSQTRLQVPSSLRREGLWVTYVLYDKTVVTEWYSAEAIDDTTFGDSANWRDGSNALVGDISISSDGYWVINGEVTNIKAQGEAGITPILRVGSNNHLQVSYTNGSSYVDVSSNPVFTQFRVSNNKLQQSTDLGESWSNISEELAYKFRESGNKIQMSKDLGSTWQDVSDYIAAWFRFTGTTGSSQADNVGKIQISRDNGATWSDLSGEFTNSLHIKGYVATVGALPSTAVQGDIYGVGPTYDTSDTEHTNPIYQLYVKNSTGWVNNGRFTSIAAGVVQTTGTSTTEVMSQDAVTRELTDLELGVIYDVSAHNDGAVFKSLSTLLGSANLSTLIPTSVRRGGMSIRFIQGSVPNSDNKYVQYRLMSDTFNATVANWQGVDEVSIIGSKNLATSGSVGNINSELLGINAVLFGGNISKIIPILQSRTNIAYIKVHENETFVFSVATNSPAPTDGVYLVIWNGAERYSTDLIMTQGQTSATLTKVFSQNYELRVELVWNDYSFNDIEVEYSIISNNYIDLVGKLKDGLGTSDIKDGSVTKEKLNKQIYSSLSILQYEEDIAELYILQKASVGVTHIYCRSYTPDIIVRAKNGNTTLWTARNSLNGINDGEVMPLICTTAGGSMNVGDLVGFIVFANITDFKTRVSASDDNAINIPNALDISLHPILQNKLIVDNVMNNDVEIILPPEVFAVKGDTLQLYYKSIIKATNPENYFIEAVCAVGKNYPRYFSYTPDDAHIGNHYGLTINVLSNKGIVLVSKTIQVYVLPKLTSPASQKNILVIGASTYSDGVITKEVKRRLVETSGDGTPANPIGLGLSNIGFIGRLQVNGIRQEATGGLGWKFYATAGSPAYRFQVSGVTQLNIGDQYSIPSIPISSDYPLIIKETNITDGVGNIRCEVYGGYEYQTSVPASGTINLKSGSGDSTITYSSYTTEPTNPFWNNGALDFQNYSTQYCNGDSIDFIVAQFGINDINDYTEDVLVNTYIKPFIRAYHTQYPNGKFLIGGLQIPSPIGGMGANYGANTRWNFYKFAIKVWEHSKAIYALARESEFSSYVRIIASTEEFDCEFGYPSSATPVNNRSETTEQLGTNGVHPTEDGKKLISDSIYRCLSQGL